MQLTDIAAVVTGGASGLGAATAELLAAGGARVTIFDSDSDLGSAHAEAIGGLFERVDVTDADQVGGALDRAQEAHGVARVVVNCAGIGRGQVTVDGTGRVHDPELFHRVLRVNLLGTFLVMSAAAGRMSTAPVIGEERGVIVNTASAAAFDGQVGQAAYAASKGGIVAMTLPVARDLARHAIRVMTVAPGAFLTPMVGAMPDGVQDQLAGEAPFPSRMGRPDEFAELVAQIVAMPMLNGETIRLDGAIRLPYRTRRDAS